MIRGVNLPQQIRSELMANNIHKVIYMAGKIDISISEAEQAVKTFCEIYDSCSFVKPGPDLFEITTPDGEKAVVSLVNGSLECQRKPEIKEKLLGLIMDAREAPKGSKMALSPVGNGKMSTPERYGRKSPINGSALEAVRDCQATEKPTYSTGGGRKAAAAKTNIAALMEAGGSLQIVGREHTPTYIEVVARASLPGKNSVDSGVSIWKQEYLAKKAWDWIVKVLMDEPGIVIGTDEYGMPEFREGATIKVRISDEGRSLMVALPAKIALWRELAREWQFAGRVCESKAYSRAADMLLRGDFQSKEELNEEASEVKAISENAKAEAV